MVRKLFLVIVLFLLVGELIGQESDEDAIIISELNKIPAEDLGAAEAMMRDRRGIRRFFKKKFRKIKDFFKKKRVDEDQDNGGDQNGGDQNGGEE
ncbi:hypothetical protein AALO_G00235830 [Alosa alosa]|uniref:Uncharacterized protein n=1 Tax=Alosa alosa TaxID=278164 RepID=A0AAV6FVK6_9TELE|nr:hypothetical protein AALO_G00235830 [Alosa alosa]